MVCLLDLLHLRSRSTHGLSDKLDIITLPDDKQPASLQPAQKPTNITMSSGSSLNQDIVVAIALGLPSLLVSLLALWIAYLTLVHIQGRCRESVGPQRPCHITSWPNSVEPLLVANSIPARALPPVPRAELPPASPR